MLMQPFARNGQQETGKPFRFDDKALNPSTNLMDVWVLAYTQSLLRFTHAEMKGTYGCAHALRRGDSLCGAERVH